MLIDCGNGVFGKLRERLDYTEVDAVLVSHLHADHFLDLVPYSYALTYAPRQQPVPVPPWPGTDTPACPRLIAPPGAREAFRRVAGAWGKGEPDRGGVRPRGVRPGAAVDGRRLEARFREVPHFVTTYAVDLALHSGAAGSPTAPTASRTTTLVEFARGTDLLLVEATLPRPERTGVRGHLTPGEAGDHARRAGAKRVS